ncbi:MAG: DUF1553 domain-containing protein [Opitutus sp.]|nr:DUF1553 domain-containing protein [Opitutus sp.]
MLAFFLLTLVVRPLAAAARAPAPLDYGRDIRPILAENCFYCHGQDATKRKAKLRLDTLEGQRSKEVVVPGQPADSELINRIFSDEEDERMPPLDSHRSLTPAQKDLLRRWVAEGAPFAAHWAFTPLVRPAAPAVRQTKWVRHPLDRFVLASLETAHLAPSPEASRENLIRRVSLDLTGLPPTPAELAAFLADKKPDAYERLVDRLLASPHYGERMALPWLDAARYADSNGYQQDGDTFQWIWRDWVVRALNANMPFDQFTIEQLAGDLLPEPTVDQRIATAFNRNHLLNGEGGAIPEEQRNVALFDRVDTTATNWLGLTVACAQCHDHKFDAITQRDYYSLMAAFNHLPETGIVSGSSFKVRVAAPLLELATPEHKAQLAALEAELVPAKVDERIAVLQAPWEAAIAADPNYPDEVLRHTAAQPVKDRLAANVGKLKKYFYVNELPKVDPELSRRLTLRDSLKNDGNPRLMVMADTKPRDTFVLERGNYEAPREKVSFATPAFLPPLPADAPRNRLGLARWLMSPEQPLTARVIANRHWQTFFGTGLVKTSEDFGAQSEAPVHRELLDWLAAEFRDSGWDVKRLHRLIVTSATYRQSSRVTPELLDRDPENRLFARGARFRLPAMAIRDQALAVSGLLVDQLGGKPVYPYQPKDIWDSLAITKERDFTYPQSTGPDLYRRSLYTFWRRTVAPANMFDSSSRNTCKVRTATTSTPLHALTTLNDPTFIEAARALAARALRAAPRADARLVYAFRTVLARAPDSAEKKILAASLAKQLARFTADPAAAQAFLTVGEIPRDPSLTPAEHAAYTAVCLAILNLDETLTKS